MITRKIVAIGGYGVHDGTSKIFEDTLKIDQEIIRLTGKKHPKILFIPTASYDSSTYCEKFEKFYGAKMKCYVDMLKLYKEKLSAAEIKNKIFNADIIYVGGGNTLRMMKFWRKLGVDVLLKNAWQKGKVMCGVSAGSICWFQYGVSDSRQFKNPKSKTYIRVRGLGLIKNLICPHVNSTIHDKSFRSKGLKNISQKTSAVSIALEDQCAIEIINDNYKIISSKNSAKAFKVFWLKGKYYQQEIPVIKKVQPLKKLFHKP